MVFDSFFAYSGRDHLSEATWAVIRFGVIDERGSPGLVRRCRTTSTE
jgi:hypothetical protein